MILDPLARMPRLGRCLFGLMALAAAPGAHGQAIWNGLPLEPGTWMEVTKVDFSEEQNLSTFSTTWYLGTRIYLARDLSLVGELPISNAKIDDTIFETQALGNPYVGVEWGQSEAVTWEIGLRLPLGDDPGTNLAAALGVNSDAADRLEAWVESSFALHLAPGFIHRGRDGLLVRLRGGPTLLVPVGDAPGDTELIAAYAGQIGYEGELVHLLGGVSGRVVPTGDGETFNHAVVSLGLDLGGLRPAAIVRVPFGDLEGVDVVYGINLFIAFGG